MPESNTLIRQLKTKQLQLDLFKLPKQPINKAVELAGREEEEEEEEEEIRNNRAR